jgi:hypothetical protein
MNAAIGALGKDEYLVLGLLAWPAHPALPAGGCAFHCLLFPLPPACNGQGNHEQGGHGVHPPAIDGGHILTPPRRQILHDFVPTLSQSPPPSTASLSPLMEGGPCMKAVGTGAALRDDTKGGET